MMMDERGNDYDDKMVSCKNNMNIISSGLRKTKKIEWVIRFKEEMLK